MTAVTAGCIFDIQRFSLHDGPGLRTLVFLKGCPLRCLWCSNPESQNGSPEVLYDHTLCIRCGNCVRACPQGALTGEPGHTPEYLASHCTQCGACVDACPSTARTLCGRMASVGDVVSESLRDVSFYRRSGGGVTIGGGEPTLQAGFARAILDTLSAHGIDSAIETSGYADPESFLSTAMAARRVYFDIKHPAPEGHRDLTGVSNELILGNLSTILEQHDDVTVRYPLVPDHNDQSSSIHALARLLRQLPRTPAVEIVPYHRYGEHKYRLLQRHYVLAGLVPPSAHHVEDVRLTLRHYGIECRVLSH